MNQESSKIDQNNHEIFEEKKSKIPKSDDMEIPVLNYNFSRFAKFECETSEVTIYGPLNGYRNPQSRGIMSISESFEFL